jgi:energy-coupling factor transporter ATP-binding protein EcfA2
MSEHSRIAGAGDLENPPARSHSDYFCSYNSARVQNYIKQQLKEVVFNHQEGQALGIYDQNGRMDSGVSTLWSYINKKYSKESQSQPNSETEETEDFGVPFLIKSS